MKRPRIPQSRHRERENRSEDVSSGAVSTSDTDEVLTFRSRDQQRGPEAETGHRTQRDAEERTAEHPQISAEDDDPGHDAAPEAEDRQAASEGHPSAATTLSFPEPKVVGVRRRRRRGLWLLGGGFLLLLVAVIVLTVSPLLTIRSVEVEGNDLLSDDRAQELLEPVVGRPLPQVGNSQVEELLAEEPVIDQVVVQGRLPDELLVEVIEHPPVAEVRHGEEIRFYNEDGEVIRTFDAEDEDQLAQAEEHATPLISEEAALQDQAVFRAIVSVLGELPASAREVMDSATATSVDSVELELDDGRRVLWGSSERGREKAAVLEAVLDSDDSAFTEAETIDISTPDAPVTR
ncbi:cell division protein FtsQ/DivIB [Nesterenkonia aerolata]|uniref:FtsQ-type POTRA domain-containing protein n=1 Tax=Nesterenkonia aerolata TaxID=3074079 RepID=A0ABU2DQ38_9MICC|nr:FtsQ-type POTRA domain-containing protein [Nesterenkonia sp. LY-0111]MDR8018480.1 FtsQ-type POTRA domain-containing protein [Nesterenkonia sp. LY-0111]